MYPTLWNYFDWCWDRNIFGTCGPFCWHGFTLIPVRMINHMPRKVWDKFIYPFLNFNGHRWSLGKDELFQSTPYNWCNHLSMLGLKLIHVSERGCWDPFYWHGLTLIPLWMNNHIPSKSWDKIPYPLQNYKGGTVEVRKWRSNFTPYFIASVIIYPMLGLKSIKLSFKQFST